MNQPDSDTACAAGSTPTVCELSQRFIFEAAHTLNRQVDAEPSRRIHGHTYHAEAVVRGAIRPDGMLIDLALFRQAIERVRGKLDHRFLDDLKGLGPATLENLSRFVFASLAETLPGVCAVSVERPATGDKCTLRV
jgi:6-pyruvoyltetrahydropterin/6-carboxytetrahydropterin synthase